jgi:hypothetical protein
MSRVFKRGGKFWIDFNDAAGVRHRKKVAPSKRVANEVLNNILDKVARQEFLGVVEDSGLSFAAFAKIWSDRILSTIEPSTATRWRGIVEQHLKPHFKGSLRAITMASVETSRSGSRQRRPQQRKQTRRSKKRCSSVWPCASTQL